MKVSDVQGAANEAEPSSISGLVVARKLILMLFQLDFELTPTLKLVLLGIIGSITTSTLPLEEESKSKPLMPI